MGFVYNALWMKQVQALMLESVSHQEILEVFARCQRRYPAIDLSVEVFGARVDDILGAIHEAHAAEPQRRPEVAAPGRCADCLSSFRQLHHEDLFLAVACAVGNSVAWGHFANEYLALLRRFAAHACKGREASEDLAQDIVMAMLGDRGAAADAVGRRNQEDGRDLPARSSDCSGKLGSYTGRGSLAGWLRAAVSHAAIDRFRRDRRQVSLDELLERQGSDGLQGPDPPDPVETALDARWAAVLVRVLRSEMDRLGARERLLLGLYHLNGVSLKVIGHRFGVHEATASRWLDRLRRVLRKKVEHVLHKEYRLSKPELRSLWQLVAEADDASLGSILETPDRESAAKNKVQGGSA